MFALSLHWSLVVAACSCNCLYMCLTISLSSSNHRDIPVTSGLSMWHHSVFEEKLLQQMTRGSSDDVSHKTNFFYCFGFMIEPGNDQMLYAISVKAVD